MHVYQVEKKFGLEHLHLVEREEREIQPHEVRIDLKAASLNYRDLLMLKGLYNPRQPLPLIPCSDGAGIISELGKNVKKWKIGDAVTSCFFANYADGVPTKEKLSSSLGGPIDGTLANSIVLPSTGIVKQPTGWTHQESATIPCAAVTAWNGLHAADRLPQTVLIQGTGGVSIAALQLAKSLGMYVILLSSHEAKMERARDLGADFTLNYNASPNWGKIVKEHTNGEGVDLVIEVGGAGTFEQSLRAVRPGGTLATIGILGGLKQELNLIPILMQQIRIQGIIVGHRRSHIELVEHLEAQTFRPVISDKFDFEHSPAAFRHMENAKHFGKIIIDISK